MWRIESAAARLRKQQESASVHKTPSQDGGVSVDHTGSAAPPGHTFLPAGSSSLTRRTTMRRGSSGLSGAGSVAVLVPMEFSTHGDRGVMMSGPGVDAATALAMTEAAYESLACLEGAGSGSLQALSAFHPDVAGMCAELVCLGLGAMCFFGRVAGMGGVYLHMCVQTSVCRHPVFPTWARHLQGGEYSVE